MSFYIIFLFYLAYHLLYILKRMSKILTKSYTGWDQWRHVLCIVHVTVNPACMYSTWPLRQVIGCTPKWTMYVMPFLGGQWGTPNIRSTGTVVTLGVSWGIFFTLQEFWPVQNLVFVEIALFHWEWNLAPNNPESLIIQHLFPLKTEI